MELATFVGHFAAVHVLSPYPANCRALTDCDKLVAVGGLADRKAVLIFRYDYNGWEMDPAIEALEVLAAQRVGLGPRQAATFSGLVHRSTSVAGYSHGNSTHDDRRVAVVSFVVRSGVRCSEVAGVDVEPSVRSRRPWTRAS